MLYLFPPCWENIDAAYQKNLLLPGCPFSGSKENVYKLINVALIYHSIYLSFTLVCFVIIT